MKKDDTTEREARRKAKQDEEAAKIQAIEAKIELARQRIEEKKSQKSQQANKSNFGIRPPKAKAAASQNNDLDDVIESGTRLPPLGKKSEKP